MSGYGQCTNPSLWMGDLEGHMDENYIRNAFQMMGHTVRSVKFLIDKKTSLPAAYCFVDFGETNLAKQAHAMCNGRRIPNDANYKKFKLNFAFAGGYKPDGQTPTVDHYEFSLHVSNLSPDVTDIQLFDYFAGRFKSAKHATVVKDGSSSRGYGFVRFHVEADMLEAIRLFNGAVGLGLKPLRVGRALPKDASKSYIASANAANASVTYPQYYSSQQQQYSQQYAQMAAQYGSGYGGYYDHYKTTNTETKAKDVNEAGDATAVTTAVTEEEDDDPLEDPEVTVDVEKSNRMILERSEEFYKALEESRWQFVDSVTMTYDDLCKA
ncbi:tRNA selenocysteine 1-associated protein 1-like [Patiria miniata]|uniref:tRNA selenocysteine-associated protein 1 n=1 Tax=Patiria miniata TaxID=46514 RepID=A0A914A135_PATMI|nr:tRNA selenocysteine 1-associated protein 1-like [Patiria miniata]